MTATRSPVRLTVLHDGDYCDEGCPMIDDDLNGSWCRSFGRSLHYPDDVVLAPHSKTKVKYPRLEACKAATVPQACAGCMHLVIMGLSGTPSYCDKYNMWPARKADGAHVPVLQCNGPVLTP